MCDIIFVIKEMFAYLESKIPTSASHSEQEAPAPQDKESLEKEHKGSEHQ
jgi:hypothetical protein